MPAPATIAVPDPVTVSVLLALAACSPSKPPPPCETSIDGVWRTGQVVEGESIGYHFLRQGDAALGYPTFRDVPAELPPGVRAAPAAIELRLASGAPTAGRWTRRYELAAEQCVVAAPVRVLRCEGPELVLELGPLPPPTDWSACPAPQGAAALAAAPMPSPATTLSLHR